MTSPSRRSVPGRAREQHAREGNVLVFDLPRPSSRCPGLPLRSHLLAGRCGASPQPRGWPGHEHRTDGCHQSWLEVGRRPEGEADERLLASYEPERMPFAHLLVNTTDRVFSAVATSSPWVRLLRSVVVPAVFTMIAWLPQGRRSLFGLISQTRINYHDGPISRGMAGGVQAGDRLPWVQWSVDGNKQGSNYDSLSLLSPQISHLRCRSCRGRTVGITTPTVSPDALALDRPKLHAQAFNRVPATCFVLMATWRMLHLSSTSRSCWPFCGMPGAGGALEPIGQANDAAEVSPTTCMTGHRCDQGGQNCAAGSQSHRMSFCLTGRHIA